MLAVEQRIDQFMPSQPPVYRVTDIDPVQLVDNGVKALALDNEGTMGETGSNTLVPAHVEWAHLAREAGIGHIAIITNKMVATEADRRMVQAWEREIGADLVVTPFSPQEGKPSPLMLYKAMSAFDVTPRQMAVVGDKASADIRAGYFAGVPNRIWTRPFGGNQHIGDRVVRGPFESVLRVAAHLKLNPVIKGQLQEAIADEGIDLSRALSFFSEEVKPGLPDGKDNIAGFGIEDIVLDDETLSAIKRPAFRVALENIKEIADHYGEVPAEKLKDLLYEHGRDIATVLTYSRVAIAAGLVATRLSDLDEKTKQTISVSLITLAGITDFLDGPSARAHKEGATTKGAAEDQNIDKLLTAAVDLFVLIPRGTIDELDVALSNGRDVLITALRQPFKDRGIDTKSDVWGKVAMATKLGSQFFGATVGQRYPGANRKLQHTATALKVASLLHAPIGWVERHERKQHLDNNLRRYIVQTALLDTIAS